MRLSAHSIALSLFLPGAGSGRPEAAAVEQALSAVYASASAQQPVPSAPAAEPSVQLPPAPPIPPTPPFLPTLEDPKENPTTPEKVALGYLLFFDKLLSKDRTMSCESCHHPELAWTEGKAVSPKVGGALNKRNAPTMLNIGYHTSFYWDGRMPTLEAVSKAAWTGQLGADPASVATGLNTNATYRAYFMRAFNS